MKGVVVTGTDTGIGKTVVAAAVSRALAATGRDVVYVKPIQSGAADGDDDAADVAALAGVPTVTGPVLGEALAPAVAARRAGASVTTAELVGVALDAARDHPGAALVVEGAGGLLVELATDGGTIADVAAALRLPVLVVARPGLGTLNHTALTLEALAQRALPVAGIVVSGVGETDDLATATNVAELGRMAAGSPVVVLPDLDLGRPLGDDAVAELAALVSVAGSS